MDIRLRHRLIRRAIIGSLGVLLSLVGGCDPSDESVVFDRVEATQYSQEDLHTLLWQVAPSEVVARLTAINHRDHPFLGSMLLGELREALARGGAERAEALVGALGWCGWEVVEEVRAAAVAFAELSIGHRLAGIGLLQRMGSGGDGGVLVALMADEDPEVARAAREVVSRDYVWDRASGRFVPAH